VPCHHGLRRRRRERDLADQHLVQHAPQRVDVTAAIHAVDP
jgi:hypothetical protein